MSATDATTMDRLAELNKSMSKPDMESLMKKLESEQGVELFAEVIKEMSDPQQNKEMQEYLAQLEAEGQTETVYGQGVQLITPEPCFVVKTKDTTGKNRVYINICKSPKVDAMIMKQVNDSQRLRTHVNLPIIVHGKKPKEGKAPDGGPLLVWDAAVHPGAIEHAAVNKQMQELLIEEVLERVEGALGAKLVREYKLPKLKYKAVGECDKPSAMFVRTGKGGEVVDGRLRPQTQPQMDAAAGAATSTTRSTHGNTSTGTSGRSSFSFKQSCNKHQQAAVRDPSKVGYRHACGAVTPSWQVVEQGKADLGRAWNDEGRGLGPISNMPQALLLRVQLPGVSSAAAIELDVSSKEAVLEVPGKYLLNVKLPYEVVDERGKAKFDASRQQLTLTLPLAQMDRQQGAQLVIKQQCQEQVQQQEEAQPLVTSGLVEDCSASNSIGSSPVLEEQLQSAEGPGAAPSGPGAAPSAQHASAAAADQQPLHDVIAIVTAKPADPRSAGNAADKTANQKSWEELHRNLDIRTTHKDQPQRPQHLEEVGPPEANEKKSAGHTGPVTGKALAAHVKQQPAEPSCSTAQAAGVLKPRLTSRQVRAVDLC